MLDVASVDLVDLAQALQDHSYEHSWWFDPKTGAVELWSDDVRDESGEDHPEERDLVAIEPLESSEAWQDMADFAAAVPDPEIRRRRCRRATVSSSPAPWRTVCERYTAGGCSA